MAICSHHYLILVLLDIKGAYDSVPPASLINKLVEVGLHGRMLTWLAEFVSNRSFLVRVGDALSEAQFPPCGVPQGSVLSPTLFNIMLHDFPVAASPNIHTALYADDIAIWTSSSNLEAAINRTQTALNTIISWANSSGFTLAPNKSSYTVITRHHQPDPSPLYIGDVRIPYTKQARYLGTILDSRLSGIPHRDMLSTKITQATNTLRHISGLHWGTNRATLLHLFQTLIQPHLDAGALSLPHDTQTINHFQRLQNKALRVCLGARRSTAISSLHCEAQRLPVRARWEQLSFKWLFRAFSLPRHHFLHDAWYQRGALSFYRRSLIALPSLLPSLLSSPSLLSLPPPNRDFVFDIHPALLPEGINFILPDRSGLSVSLPPATNRGLFQNLLQSHQDFLLIGTDGSGLNQRAGAGVVCDQLNIKDSIPLPLGTSVLTAELFAIRHALFKTAPAQRNLLIVSDSLSSIQALSHQPPSLKEPIISHILQYLHHHLSTAKVTFLWVPGHHGIPVNEAADDLARAACSLPPPADDPPPSLQDCYRLISNTIDQQFHDTVEDQLQQYPHLRVCPRSIWRNLSFSSRRIESSFTRLRLGHTFLPADLSRTGYDLDPNCTHCHVPFTGEHLLVTCPKYDSIRRKTIQRACQALHLPVTLQTILTLGANTSGHPHPTLASAVEEFLRLSPILP